MSDDHVVLVDIHDNEIATMGKLDAHRRPGLLHRAFSVVVRDTDGRILLQRRATTKYHFAGLWATSCCSHPRPGERLVDQARQRLREELGLHVDELRHVGTTIYQAVDPVSGLHEHELDHILVTEIDPQTTIDPNADEVDDIAWVTPTELAEAIKSDVPGFAPWTSPVLRTALPKLHDPLHRSLSLESVIRLREPEHKATTTGGVSTICGSFSQERHVHWPTTR